MLHPRVEGFRGLLRPVLVHASQAHGRGEDQPYDQRIAPLADEVGGHGRDGEEHKQGRPELPQQDRHELRPMGTDRVRPGDRQPPRRLSGGQPVGRGRQVSQRLRNAHGRGAHDVDGRDRRARRWRCMPRRHERYSPLRGPVRPVRSVIVARDGGPCQNAMFRRRWARCRRSPTGPAYHLSVGTASASGVARGGVRPAAPALAPG